MNHQGTSGLLELAEELRKTAPHVADVFDLRRGAALMLRAADAIERLSVHEPDIEVQHGEN